MIYGLPCVRWKSGRRLLWLHDETTRNQDLLRLLGLRHLPVVMHNYWLNLQHRPCMHGVPRTLRRLSTNLTLDHSSCDRANWKHGFVYGVWLGRAMQTHRHAGCWSIFQVISDGWSYHESAYVYVYICISDVIEESWNRVSMWHETRA